MVVYCPDGKLTVRKTFLSRTYYNEGIHEGWYFLTRQKQYRDTKHISIYDNII